MLSDQHTIEFEFEEIQPTLCGARLDLLVSGTAVLAVDPGYDFYVKSITLPASVKDMLAEPGYFTGRPWKASSVTLNKPADGDHAPEAMMFRLIAPVIEESRAAIDAWHGELEEAA